MTRSGLSGAFFGSTPMPGVMNHGPVSSDSSLPASCVRPSRFASVEYGRILARLDRQFAFVAVVDHLAAAAEALEEDFVAPGAYT